MTNKKPFLSYQYELQLSTVWAIATKYNYKRSYLFAAFKDVNPNIVIDQKGNYSLSSLKWYEVENRYFAILA